MEYISGRPDGNYRVDGILQNKTSNPPSPSKVLPGQRIVRTPDSKTKIVPKHQAPSTKKK